jgi:uncharacterized protein YbjT (DUF2867 family)
MILVTGAAGKTGRAVIPALIKRGEWVSALVHHKEQADSVRALGVESVTVGSLNDQRALDRAMKGVKSVYHIAPNVHVDELTIGHSVLVAAQRHAVKQFVYHSVLHPHIEEMPHHWLKLRVEELIFKSGVPYTILQPCAYMQNILPRWGEILAEGVYRIPYPADTRLGLVDLNDVAEAAAIVVTTSGHIGATYELAGSDVMTQTEVAGALSETIGRTVTAEVITRDAWIDGARQSGLSGYAIDALTRMFNYYELYGLWGNPRTLTGLIGRPPTTFTQFVNRTLEELATIAK